MSTYWHGVWQIFCLREAREFVQYTCGQGYFISKWKRSWIWNSRFDIHGGLTRPKKLVEHLCRQDVGTLRYRTRRRGCVSNTNPGFEEPNLNWRSVTTETNWLKCRPTRILGFSSSSSRITKRYEAWAWTNSVMSSTMNADIGTLNSLARTVRTATREATKRKTHSNDWLTGRIAYFRTLYTVAKPWSSSRSWHLPTIAPHKHRASRQFSSYW